MILDQGRNSNQIAPDGMARVAKIIHDKTSPAQDQTWECYDLAQGQIVPPS